MTGRWVTHHTCDGNGPFPCDDRCRKWVEGVSADQLAADVTTIENESLRMALTAMVYVHPCNCGTEIPMRCARCRAVEVLGFDPAIIGEGTAPVADQDGAACEHEWVSARNEAVLEGEMCPRCGAIRAEGAAQDGAA